MYFHESQYPKALHCDAVLPQRPALRSSGRHADASQASGQQSAQSRIAWNQIGAHGDRHRRAAVDASNARVVRVFGKSSRLYRRRAIVYSESRRCITCIDLHVRNGARLIDRIRSRMSPIHHFHRPCAAAGIDAAQGFAAPARWLLAFLPARELFVALAVCLVAGAATAWSAAFLILPIQLHALAHATRLDGKDG